VGLGCRRVGLGCRRVVLGCRRVGGTLEDGGEAQLIDSGEACDARIEGRRMAAAGICEAGEAQRGEDEHVQDGVHARPANLDSTIGSQQRAGSSCGKAASSNGGCVRRAMHEEHGTVAPERRRVVDRQPRQSSARCVRPVDGLGEGNVGGGTTNLPYKATHTTCDMVAPGAQHALAIVGTHLPW
jgi:hypothetical protein